MGEKHRTNSGGGSRPPWKRGKHRDGKLEIGSRGLLITNSASRKHKEAMQECLTILREHCESLHPEYATEGSSSASAGPVNVEEAIKRELEGNKRYFDRFVPGPCISQNLNVVHFQNEVDLPSTYVRDIFHKMLGSDPYSARFLCRIVPYDLVCKAEGEPFTEALTALVAREFPESQANGVVQKEEQKEYVTWSLSYGCRNSNALKRQDVLDLAVQLVGRNYRVDLRKPDKLLVVEVVKGSCGLAVISDYKAIAHFKLNISQPRLSCEEDAKAVI
ncbi:THUMP domain-containing protein 1 like protein [Babesia gibsoni]|uniref:THUMP domain-containing protein 1 like protein n=1 Tax=Babesia gibsoni TaxID=33632 RepID=A0AAD8PF07_BABGI|nr:THUMP domain-containing protein 1 like protein [Babesia gibsoni]